MEQDVASWEGGDAGGDDGVDDGPHALVDVLVEDVGLIDVPLEIEAEDCGDAADCSEAVGAYISTILKPSLELLTYESGMMAASFCFRASWSRQTITMGIPKRMKSRIVCRLSSAEA